MTHGDIGLLRAECESITHCLRDAQEWHKVYVKKVEESSEYIERLAYHKTRLEGELFELTRKEDLK